MACVGVLGDLGLLDLEVGALQLCVLGLDLARDPRRRVAWLPAAQHRVRGRA